MESDLNGDGTGYHYLPNEQEEPTEEQPTLTPEEFDAVLRHLEKQEMPIEGMDYWIELERKQQKESNEK
jgi:hypothetical protein